jgi:hypothetical protein
MIVDAKNVDVGFGRAAPLADLAKTGQHKSRETHLEAIREMSRSGLVEVMLISALTGEGSKVTPAIRLNDAKRRLVGPGKQVQGRSIAAPSTEEIAEFDLRKQRRT